MQNKIKRIEKLVICLLIISILAGFSGVFVELLLKIIKELIANNDLNGTYKIYMAIIFPLVHTKVLINITISIFIFIISPQKETRLAWSSVSLLFGYNGFILFLINQIYMYKLKDKEIDNSITFLGLFSVPAILILISFSIYSYYMLGSISDFANSKKPNIESISIISNILPKIVVAFWSWKISKKLGQNTWLWSLFAISYGIISPIILIGNSVIWKGNWAGMEKLTSRSTGP